MRHKHSKTYVEDDSFLVTELDNITSLPHLRSQLRYYVRDSKSISLSVSDEIMDMSKDILKVYYVGSLNKGFNSHFFIIKKDFEIKIIKTVDFNLNYEICDFNNPTYPKIKCPMNVYNMLVQDMSEELLGNVLSVLSQKINHDNVQCYYNSGNVKLDIYMLFNAFENKFGFDNLQKHYKSKYKAFKSGFLRFV